MWWVFFSPYPAVFRTRNSLFAAWHQHAHTIIWCTKQNSVASSKCILISYIQHHYLTLKEFHEKCPSFLQGNVHGSNLILTSQHPWLCKICGGDMWSPNMFLGQAGIWSYIVLVQANSLSMPYLLLPAKWGGRMNMHTSLKTLYF